MCLTFWLFLAFDTSRAKFFPYEENFWNLGCKKWLFIVKNVIMIGKISLFQGGVTPPGNSMGGYTPSLGSVRPNTPPQIRPCHLWSMDQIKNKILFGPLILLKPLIHIWSTSWSIPEQGAEPLLCRSIIIFHIFIFHLQNFQFNTIECILFSQLFPAYVFKKKDFLKCVWVCVCVVTILIKWFRTSLKW